MNTKLRDKSYRDSSIHWFTITFFLLFTTTYGLFSQTTVNITTTGSGTWTVPCGVTTITVQVWGGGGGGYGDNNNDSNVGFGGGGGGYSTAILTVTPGQQINYNVGTGGNGGNPNGGNGGNSFFSTLTANGGNGGTILITGLGGSSNGGTTNTPGNNGNGGTNPIGGAGGTAGGPGGGVGGAGGTDGLNGNPGSAPGGGGGASGDKINAGGDETGGAGARGEIRISYMEVFQNYCQKTFAQGSISITNVNFAGINNSTPAANVNTEGVYYSYCDQATVMVGSANNISVTGRTYGPNTFHIRAYVDWNQDGDFIDANESFYIGQIVATTDTQTTLNSTITTPLTALEGYTQMRVIYQFSTDPIDPCSASTSYGQVEDYTVNVIPSPPCTSPISQPTTLLLTPGGASISGTFAEAVPAPDNYLVILSMSPSPPTITNGMNYVIGSNFDSDYFVVDTDNNTSFTATGLNTLTTYYFYIYSFNNLCSNGPLYNLNTPLIGSTTTTVADPSYCIPSSTNGGIYLSSVASIGSISDAVNAPTGYATGGYGNYSNMTIATQIPGGGINLDIVLSGTFSTSPPPQSSSAQFIRTWVDWNKDGSFNDTNELVYTSGNVATSLNNTFGFVVPIGTIPGNYRLRIRTRSFIDSSTIIACGIGYASGETEDYSIAIVQDCEANITTTSDGTVCGIGNSVILTASGTPDTTEFRWYNTAVGGSLVGTSDPINNQWTTPPLTENTVFYVTAFNGTCESFYRRAVYATVNSTTDITFTPDTPVICGDNNLLTITASAGDSTDNLLFVDFENGNWGNFNVTTLTNIYDSNNSGNITGQDGPNINAPWSMQIGAFVPIDTSVWTPAISSGNVGNSFAFTTSDYNYQQLETIMTSPIINTTDYTNLTLTFRHYYSDFSNDFANVEISVNNGAWNSLAVYNSDIGTAPDFTTETINLNGYIGLNNIRIRFRYVAVWGDGWAVDDIRIFGSKPLNASFSWTGTGVQAYYQLPAIPANEYTNQLVSTIYMQPTQLQLESDAWTYEVTTNLPNGCTASVDVVVTNNTKLWKGTNSQDWTDPNNWSPIGVPSIDNCVVIDSQSIIDDLTTYDAYGKNLTVKPTGKLTLDSTHNLIIKEWVQVETGGTFDLENNSSLIQIDNVANNGTVTYRRNADNIIGSDYVYWSSPVVNQPLNSIYTIPTQGPKYKWNPISTNTNGGQGNWENANGNTMETARGYIVRGSSNASMSATTITSSFTGVPNNGTIFKTVQRGTYTGGSYSGTNGITITNGEDNWNLIGNPYPSAINALQFLSDNSSVIEGNVRLWTHNTAIGPNNGSTINNPFYGSYAYNYSTNDYITINFLGSTEPLADEFIRTGQGFFVQMFDGPAITTNVTFNNAQRSNTYANDNFFRTFNEIETDSTGLPNLERHRIWLDLVDANNNPTRSLIGYIEGATLGFDSFFDATNRPSNSVGIFSLIGTEIYSIQGRPLPFNQNDQVPLGIYIPSVGTYTLAINKVDGLFENPTQNIFLEDTALGIIHNLKTNPYSFTSGLGMHNNRFILRYTNETLNLTTLESNENVFAYSNEFVWVKSIKNAIKNIVVYDLLGKKVDEYNNVNGNEIKLKNLMPGKVVYILRITLENDVIVNKKIIF